MVKTNHIERELNEIRSDFYEKTKDMSPSEMNAYIKSLAATAEQQHGIQTLEVTQSNESKTA
jgi:hypothetical protein